MRIFFLGNNWVGWQIVQWLKEQNEKIIGLAIHPPGKRKYGDRIIECAQVRPEDIYDGSQLRQSKTLEAIKELHPDIGVSAFFGHILRQELLALFPNGMINIHPAYLPYNRGAYPNVWSILDGTPSGVTIHYIDAGVDTGDLIAQQEIPIEPIDTGETLYRKLESACVALFKETWPSVRSGRAPRVPQRAREGTFHSAQSVEQIDCIDLNRTYTGAELIDTIRARTFPPYRGAYFVHEGRRVYLRLQLLYESQLDEGGQH